MITSLGVFSESKHNAHPIFPLTTLHRATSKHKAACRCTMLECVEIASEMVDLALDGVGDAAI